LWTKYRGFEKEVKRMREIDEANRLINEFLAEVELRLPSWLKIREEELDEVLQELKEHIEDKAQSFVDQGMAYIEAIKKSITEMGNPVEIANEYKKRGTPKYYITVELWNLYIKSLKLILALIIPIMSIFIALDVVITILEMGNWFDSLLSGIGNLLFTSMIGIIGITILFVYLSMEGYTPEDLKKIFTSRKAKEHKSEFKFRRHYIQKAKREINKRAKSEISPDKMIIPKGYKRPIELIIGNIFGIVFGIVAIWQPITYINALLDPLFLNLVSGVGISLVILGIIGMIQGILAVWTFKAYKYLLPIKSAIAILFIPLLILFIINPQVFPLFYWSDTTGLVIFNIPPECYWLYQMILIFILIAILSVNIKNIIKAAKLKRSDFYLN